MQGVLNKISKIRGRLNRLQRDTGWYLGLNQSYLANVKGARILVYHGICIDDPLRFNTLFVKLKTFEKQLSLYKKYFNIISLNDFYEQKFDKDRFNICLTFDDGFANNYKYVLPLLERYEVPATFFITGVRDAGYDILWNDVLCIAYQYGPVKFRFRNEDFIKGRDKKYISSATGQRLVDILRKSGIEDKIEMMKLLDQFKKKAVEDYWLQMTQEEIRMLSASKWVTIGSHDYFHNDVANVPVNFVAQDFARSKQILENITGKEIRALAFPYGSYTREVVKAAKNTGFKQLLATDFLFQEDKNDTALRERFIINPFISDINQLYANIKGNYQ